MAKPRLADLLPRRARKPTLPQRQREELMIDVWLPHFVAQAFRIEDSMRAAFPNKDWSKDAASEQAAKLVKHPQWQEKFATYCAKLDQECEIDARHVLSGLYHQSLANIFDYFETDEYGNQVPIPPERLTIHQQRNVKKLKIHNRVVETKKRGRSVERIMQQRIEYEIVDGLKAYALLGKAIGMFVERGVLDVNVNIADKLEQATERVKRKRLEQQGTVH